PHWQRRLEPAPSIGASAWHETGQAVLFSTTVLCPYPLLEHSTNTCAFARPATSSSVSSRKFVSKPPSFVAAGPKSHWSSESQACRIEPPLREWRNWQTRKT